jgi:hypothetical protein
MKISIRLKPQQVATAAGAYSAPDMGAAEQLQYSDDELAERDKEEKARQEVADAEERKKAAEKQKKDAAKAPQTPKESGEDAGDKSDDDEEGDESEEDEESDESGDDSEESDDDSDDDSDDSDDMDDEGDEEATAASKLPYPEAQSKRKASDLIPAETMEKVVDPEVQKEEDEKKETEAAQARPLSKEDPNNKNSQGKKLDKENGNTLVATAASVSGLPYPDVKLRNR